MAVDDIFEFKIHGFQGGQPIENVVHYLLYSASGDQLDMIGALDALRTKWQVPLLDWLSVQYNMFKMSFQLVAKHNAPETKVRSLLYESSIDLVGEAAGDALPPQCSVYTLLYGVASNSKYFRGAKYWAGIPESNTANGILSPTSVTAWVNILTTCLVDVAVPGAEGGTLRPVIWSKKAYKANQIPYLCVINQFRVSNIIRTQRRRTVATSTGGG